MKKPLLVTDMKNNFGDKMEWEIHYTRVIEADDFFDAVDKIKYDVNDIEDVISVCPFVEDEDMMEIL